MSQGSQSSRGLLRDSLRLVLGMAGAQGLVLLAMPLWSRQYAAEDFARLGVWTAVTGVVSVAASLRFEAILMLPERDQEALALYRLASRVVLLIGAVLVLLSTCAWANGSELGLRLEWLLVLDGYAPLAAVVGALSAWMGLGQAWLNRQQAYGAVNRGRLTMAMVTVAATTAMGSFAWSPGLCLGQGLGVLAASCLTWRAVRNRAAASALDAAGGPGWRELLKRHRDAPMYLWPSALMDTVTQQLPFVLAVAWFGVAEAGQFTLAWRSLAFPMFMLAAAVSPVFYQRFARLRPQEPGGQVVARQLLVRVWACGGALVLMLTALMTGFGETLFVLVFGPAWREAGALATWLTPMVAAMALSSATSGSLLVLGGQRWVPMFGLAMLVGRPLAFAWASHEGRLVLAVQAWCLLELCMLGIYNALIWHRLRDH